VTWKPAVYSELMPPLAVGWREPVRPALSVGQRSASRTWACARVASMFSAAMRRSRLFCSASAIRRFRRSSPKKACQSSSAAGVVLAAEAAAAGNCAATGAAGRS